MKGYSRKDPQLLDLIPKDREWAAKRAEETIHGLSEEKKLELSLGPPGGDWTIRDTKSSHESLLSFGYFPNNPCVKSPWQHQTKAPTYLHHLQSAQLPVMKESSQPCSNRAAAVELQRAEKKAFSPAPANTAVPNSSTAQKRCPQLYVLACFTIGFFPSWTQYIHCFYSTFVDCTLWSMHSVFYSFIVCYVQWISFSSFLFVHTHFYERSTLSFSFKFPLLVISSQ